LLSARTGISTLFVLSVFLIIAAGCRKGQETGTSPGAPTSAAFGGTGEALMASNGCGRCHRSGGGGQGGGMGQTPGGGRPGAFGRGGGGGPDITHEGSNPQHTAQWIADHIKNPTSHTPGSRMPRFAEKMSDADIQTLANYLASLK